MPPPSLRRSAAAAIALALALAPAADAQLRAVIEPDAPTDHDPLRLLVTGLWGDSCAPRPVSVTVEDDLVTVVERVEIPPGTLCSSAVFSYGYSVDFGPLPRGLYRVELRRQSLVGDPTEVLVAELLLRIVEGEGPLLHDRFRIAVEWRDSGGRTGIGRPAARPSRSSVPVFFFRPENVEAVIKVLNGCGINGRYWVFLAAATNVEYTVRIVDTATGADWAHTNPLGELSAAVADVRAFDCGP